MTCMAAKRKELMMNSMVLEGFDALLSDMGTEQIQQALCASLEVHLYGQKNA